MKKYLILASATLLALAACNKEVDNQDPITGNEDVVLTFTSERPQLDVTRTAWDATSKSIVWSAGDKISVGYTLDGAWMGKSSAANLTATPKVSPAFYASNQVSIDAEDACVGTFKVPSSFDFSNSGKAVFYGVFPNSAVGSNTDYAPSLTITLPSSQVPGNNTFDSSADIMIGKSGEITLTDAFPTDPIELDWTRLVAHADLTFSGLNSVDGETVSKITLTFNDEAKVAGSFYVDITNGAITTINGSKNEIVLSGSNLVLSDHNIKAWVSLMPVSFTSLNVVIETNKAFYSRAISASKTFLKNARNVLTIKMADAVRTEKTGQLVADGYYVISYSDYMMTVGTESNDYRGSAAKNITDPSDDAIWRIAYVSESDAYTIHSVGANKDLYGATTSSGKDLKLGSGTTNLFTIEKSNAEATTYRIAPSGNNYRAIGYNTSSPRFALYEGGTSQPITLDLTSVTVAETPVITIENDERTKTVAASATSVTFAYVPNMFATTAPTVAVAADADGIIKGTPTAADGTITVILNPNEDNTAKTATLTVSGTGIASPITLTINQEAKVGDVFAYTFTDKSWSATRNDVSENWTSGKDGAGFNNNGIQVTTSVTGANGTSPFSFIDISEIEISYCTNASNGAGSIKVQVGDNAAQTIAITKDGGVSSRTLSFKYSPKQSGKVTITVYCTTNSVYLLGATITAASMTIPTSYAINLATVEHGTIQASKNSAYAGEEITLSAQPASGYALDSWSVKEVKSGNGVSVTNGSFIMPEDDVIVSASFVEAAEKTWVLVTDESSLKAGDVIVFAAYQATYNASGSSHTDNKVMGPIASSVGTAIDVTFSSDGSTIASLPSNAQQYTLGGESGAWTIMNGSKYLTKGDKKISEESNSYSWTITIESNNATIASKNEETFKLQYNPNNGNGRFATYSSTQKPIRIYRYQ